MTPQEFFQQIDQLLSQKKWQSLIDWCEAYYPQVKPLLTDEEREQVQGGILETATLIVEGERRAWAKQSDHTAERELARTP